jgi:hypothetical protein
LAVSARDLTGFTQFGTTNGAILKLLGLNSGTIFSVQAAFGGGFVADFNASAAVYPARISGVFDNQDLFSSTGYISAIRMRDHLIINTTKGVLVGDSMAPTTAAERTFRSAGLPQPCVTGWTATFTNAGAIPNNMVVGYAFVSKKTLADGYQVISVPSPIWRYLNTSGLTADFWGTLAWHDTDDLLAGDTIEMYRTDGFSATTYATDPGVTLKLCVSHTITTAEAAAKTCTIRDTQPLGPSPTYVTSGRECYTNPYQSGALGGYEQPPISRVMATFKGFAFFANVTDRPLWTLSVPAGCSSTAVTATNTAFFRVNGIGTRTGAGTVTLGSAVITAVSATDILGIVAEQMWNGSLSVFGPGAKVSSVGANTITMSSNALAAGTTFNIVDVIEISGSRIPVTDGAGLAFSLNQVFSSQWEITPNQTVPLVAGATYQQGFTLSIQPIKPSEFTTAVGGVQQISIRGTNEQNYSPVIPGITAAVQTSNPVRRKNLLQWSLDNQPEHCPFAANNAFVGAGEVVALVPTRDILWIFCTDGLYRLTGTGGLWQVSLVDPSLVIAAPGCATNLRDLAFAYTNRGLVRIDDSGIQELSNGLLNDLLPGPSYVETQKTSVHADETNDEIYLLIQGASFGSASTLYVCSEVYGTFSTLTFSDQRITTLGYNKTPATPGQEGFPVIATSPQGGAMPGYYSWDSTAGSPLKPTALIQPFYTQDPYLVKQWIDTTWIFEPADAGTAVVSIFNNTTQYGTGVIKAHANDSRITFGVPRRCAVRNSIMPGIKLTIAPAAPITIRGVSMRFKPITSQQVTR